MALSSAVVMPTRRALILTLVACVATMAMWAEVQAIDAPQFPEGCPNNMTATPGLGEDMATVDFPLPTGVNLTVICNPEPGSSFLIGFTTVTCTATDAVNATNNCTFEIGVGPAFKADCPENKTAPTDEGSANGTVSFEHPTGLNDSTNTPAQIHCEPQSGDPFPVGQTDVTCTATDAGTSLQTSCVFTVQINDTGAPFLTCPDVFQTTTDPGQNYTQVNWRSNVTATDAVDGPIADIHCVDAAGNNATSGGAYYFGITSVTCSATDASGNEGSCNFAVNVTDEEAPDLTCPDDIQTTTYPGQNYTQVNWTTNAIATDAVDGPITDIHCVDAAGNNATSGGAYYFGTTRVTCSATDASGNKGSCNFAVNVTDEEAPVVNCPDDIPTTTYPGQNYTQVDWRSNVTATDAVDGPIADIHCVDAAGNNATSGGAYYFGTTRVTCSATDASGNEGSCNFAVNVTDEEAPVVNCPDDIPTTTYPGQNYTQVDWRSNVTATDAVDGPIADIHCVDAAGNNATSGGAYYFGTTRTVTCSATDASGNKGSCNFTITVVCSNETVCQNGGTYDNATCTCSCPMERTGLFCEACSECQNGGSFQNEFTCECECSGLYTDPLCSVCPDDIECLNGGTLDSGSCSCECSEGWTGKACEGETPSLPEDEYPDLGADAVKEVTVEIGFDDTNSNCNPANESTDACSNFKKDFMEEAGKKYQQVAGYKEVIVNGLRNGSIIVAHKVVYSYNKMTQSGRSLTAQELYAATIGPAVDDGKLGDFKLTACESCAEPADVTDACTDVKVECPLGTEPYTSESSNSDGSCYLICRAVCKAQPDYCNDGTCVQNVGVVSCSCPQSQDFMYLGVKCQLRVELLWLYVGCGVGGGLLLVLLIILVCCLIRSNRKLKKLRGGDEEDDEETSEMKGEVRAVHTNRGYQRDSSLGPDGELQEPNGPVPPSPDNPRPYSYLYRNGGSNAGVSRSNSAVGAGGAGPRGQYESRIPQDHPRVEGGVGEAGEELPPGVSRGSRGSYFWGNLAVPEKEEAEMIHMTSVIDPNKMYKIQRPQVSLNKNSDLPDRDYF